MVLGVTDSGYIAGSREGPGPCYLLPCGPPRYVINNPTCTC